MTSLPLLLCRHYYAFAGSMEELYEIIRYERANVQIATAEATQGKLENERAKQRLAQLTGQMEDLRRMMAAEREQAQQVLS